MMSPSWQKPGRKSASGLSTHLSSQSWNCNEQLQAGEEIELESLSKELAGVSEVSFQAFTAEKGYELEESFPADRSTLRQLTKFAGSGGGLTINFDALLLGERIFWDPATDTLTIKGTPPNLRDQLQRRTSGGK
jgi:nucleoid-associated protein